MGLLPVASLEPPNKAVIAVANDRPAWNQPFVGELGELRLWSRALSDEELCEHAEC